MAGCVVQHHKWWSGICCCSPLPLKLVRRWYHSLVYTAWCAPHFLLSSGTHTEAATELMLCRLRVQLGSCCYLNDGLRNFGQCNGKANLAVNLHSPREANFILSWLECSCSLTWYDKTKNKTQLPLLFTNAFGLWECHFRIIYWKPGVCCNKQQKALKKCFYGNHTIKVSFFFWSLDNRARGYSFELVCINPESRAFKIPVLTGKPLV